MAESAAVWLLRPKRTLESAIFNVSATVTDVSNVQTFRDFLATRVKMDYCNSITCSERTVVNCWSLQLMLVCSTRTQARSPTVLYSEFPGTRAQAQGACHDW